MDDLISREAALDAIDNVFVEDESYKAWFKIAIKNLPSAQPKRKKGKWTIERMNTYELSYGTTAYEPVYRCSACGISTESYLRLDEPIMPEDADFPKFCPNCGADMRGTDNG